METILVIILALAALLHMVRYAHIRRKWRETAEKDNRQKRTIRELNIISELTSSLLSSLELESVLEMLLEKSKELLRAKRSAVILVDSNGDIQDFTTSMGPAQGCKIRLSGILRKVFIEMTPVRSDDISSLPGFSGLPEKHPEIGSIIVVPIILRGEVIGELIVTDKTDTTAFTHDDEDLLLMIAFQAAFAIEKARLHQDVLKMATTDGLTGLKNHRAFQERLTEEIERYKRYNHPFSLLFVDIDHFKDFNDAFGHQSGDEVLKQIARIMTGTIRENDLAARYGGEEFAIILPETTLDSATVTAERLRKNVEAHTFRFNDEPWNVTVSVGIACFPDDGISREEIIEAADKALYFAKRSGRNKVCTYR